MKKLNKVATEIFLSLLDLAKEHDYVKLDNSNGSYMAAHFELLHPLRFGEFDAKKYSLTHYYMQNGDLVPDPDMQFIFIPSISAVFPCSFQDNMRYQEPLFFDDSTGSWKIIKKQQADLALFANTWLKNIKHQQEI